MRFPFPNADSCNYCLGNAVVHYLTNVNGTLFFVANDGSHGSELWALLTVNQAPTFTSTSAASFTVGTAESFTVTTSGFPTVSTLTESGKLPGGVTFVNNQNGTATLSGTPNAGTAGTYHLTFTASNGVASDATQSFTLTVTAAGTATLVAGSAGSFSDTTNGSAAADTPTATGKVPGGDHLWAVGMRASPAPSSSLATLDLLFEKESTFHSFAGLNDDGVLDATSLDRFFGQEGLVSVR
jgi:hypothetical protein